MIGAHTDPNRAVADGKLADAMLAAHGRDGELLEVDSRPSDAIALAVTANAPIYVSEEVLDEVAQ